VLGGEDDPAISASMLAGWQEHTSAAFVQHEFSGGHFYIHEQRAAIVSRIVESLAILYE